MERQTGRRHPAEGVHIYLDQPTIAFLTICSRKRKPHLATPDVHEALLRAWTDADAWSIGFYMVMPDHVHLFCSPHRLEVSIERWVTFWKRRVRAHAKAERPMFQSHCFHHRLRKGDSYSEKWEYVRRNPVRAGLVSVAADWPFQGVMNDLWWM